MAAKTATKTKSTSRAKNEMNGHPDQAERVEATVPRLGSIPIFVSDQDRALDFYCNKLGFVAVADNKLGEEFRWVAVARRKGETELILYRPVPSMNADSMDELTSRIGQWTGMVFLTDDVQTTYQAMRERGVEFDAEPSLQPWGGWETWFADPDGNRFHLVQRPANM